MELVIDLSGLNALIANLRKAGRTVIGPTIRDGAIVHDEIEGTVDLPQGWTEEQAPGEYRLSPTDDDRIFGFSSPAESWKRFVFPPRSLLIRARREPDGIKVDRPTDFIPSVAFFGIRSCDLAAISVLDRVFLDADHPDPDYGRRRADIFFVAVACSDPGSTCFCVSMGTGPSPVSPFDLAVSEIVSPTSGAVEYLVRSGSERGVAELALLTGRAAAETDHTAAQNQHDRATQAMGRVLNPADPPLAARDPNDPQWQDIAMRCLACGNCTMVCPTCFCSTVEDTTSLSGRESDRTRVWDSCFTLDFSHMPGGSTRSSIASRYRQWLLHKLVTWHDQFDMSGCVGCGRCLTWCPVGIDLTAEVAALAESQRRQDRTTQELA